MVGSSGVGSTLSNAGRGSAEWLLRALAVFPELTATGLDVSSHALRVGRERAEMPGLESRLVLVQESVEAADTGLLADTILCVGSTHAFGGLSQALAWAARRLRPGGRVQSRAGR
jgi:ubiquinone/menaquinone biosynthesis C-methylase UbiE